jgi:hypothetical protein
MDPLMTTFAPGKRVAHGVVANAAGAAVAAGKPEKATPGGSVTVAISGEGRALAEDSTQGDAMTERLSKMREALSRIQAMPSGGAQRKDMARARIQQLKDRIEAMRQMMVGLSPAAAKAMAREIRAMAHELKQAAGVLLSGGESADAGGNGVAVADAGAGATGADAAAQAAAAEPAAATTADGAGAATEATSAANRATQQANALQLGTAAPDEGATEEKEVSPLAPTDEADADTSGVSSGADGTSNVPSGAADVAASIQAAFQSSGGDGASADDEELIRKVAAALKSLMAMVKSQMRDGEHDDDIQAATQALGTTPGTAPA